MNRDPLYYYIYDIKNMPEDEFNLIMKHSHKLNNQKKFKEYVCECKKGLLELWYEKRKPTIKEIIDLTYEGILKTNGMFLSFEEEKRGRELTYEEADEIIDELMEKSISTLDELEVSLENLKSINYIKRDKEKSTFIKIFFSNINERIWYELEKYANIHEIENVFLETVDRINEGIICEYRFTYFSILFFWNHILEIEKLEKEVILKEGGK